MLLPSMCIVALSVFALSSEACYFHNCPNEFTWSKRQAQLSDVMRTVNRRLPVLKFGGNLLQCPKSNDENSRSSCDFVGSQVCCARSEEGDVRCNAQMIGIEARGKAISQQIENSLRDFVDAEDPDKLSLKTTCARVGLCCANDGECDPEISCSRTMDQNLGPNLSFLKLLKGLRTRAGQD